MMPVVELAEGTTVLSRTVWAAGSMTRIVAMTPAHGTATGAADRSVACPAVRGRRSRAASRLVALGMAAGGVGMLPWLVYLAVSLPPSAVAWHWPAAWVGLDVMEAAGLTCTGALMLRKDGRYCLTAIATAMLLTTDAWFDVTTAPPGSGELADARIAGRRMKACDLAVPG